jgi:EAL domain-containing protein (putative c-di-GMP-specific phosphodiesterase class I)
VEITEQAQVEDYDELNVALGHLREVGVRIAVDDAGAGYASLRHILRLEPDVIKLDKSLVRNVHRDRPRRALATALISFAAEIGATIVAEGIESAEELDALRDLGVTFGQGYHLARPHRPPVAPLVAVA